MKTPVAYLPALPGFYLVETVHGDEDDWDIITDIDLTPIIGWAIELEEVMITGDFFTMCTPICYETVPDDFVIMTPDGKITIPAEETFENKDEYLDGMKRRLEAKKKKNATP